MSTSCCNCFFDYYLLKINKSPNFLKKISSLNPNDLPKISKREWPEAGSACGWYSQTTSFFFHACRKLIENILEITRKVDNLILQEVFSKSCDFVNSSCLQTENEVGCLADIC